MNTQELKRTKPWCVFVVLSFFTSMIWMSGCESNEIPKETYDVYPPDFTRPSGIESYGPDSGGVRTRLVLKGYNLGTDTSYLKVTVNGKNARVVGAQNDYVHAIVPARADTGAVKLFVTKADGVVEDFEYENIFTYYYTRSVTTVYGTGESKREDGPLSSALSMRPWFIMNDIDDTVYILEEGRGTNKNGAFRRIKDGQVETMAENNNGLFRSPTEIKFSPGQDTLYMAQTYNPDTQMSFAVIFSTREGGFINFRQLVDFDMAYTTTVAVHPKTGEVFFNSQDDGWIYRYTGEGTDMKSYERLFQINGSNNTEIRMEFDASGKNLYLVVCNRHCIYKVNYDENTRTFSTPELFVGAWAEDGYTNGTGTVARFSNPRVPTFDSDGMIYVADKGNHCIRKITPEGVVTLHAGTPGQSGFDNGDTVTSTFNQPECATMLSDDVMFVADRGNNAVRRVIVE